jgi:hypothetical protein
VWAATREQALDDLSKALLVGEPVEAAGKAAWQDTPTPREPSAEKNDIVAVTDRRILVARVPPLLRTRTDLVAVKVEEIPIESIATMDTRIEEVRGGVLRRVQATLYAVTITTTPPHQKTVTITTHDHSLARSLGVYSHLLPGLTSPT